MTYLTRHKGVYWFRRAVPAALQPILGRREVKASLRTSSAAEARRLGLCKAQEVEALFRDVAAGVIPARSAEQPKSHAPTPTAWRPPPADDLPHESVLRRAVERYDAHLARFLANRVLGDLGAGRWTDEDVARERRMAMAQLRRWREAVARLDIETAGEALEQALAFEGRHAGSALARTAPPALIMAAARIALGHAERRLRRLSGEWDPFGASLSDATPPAPASKTLAQVLDAYHAERRFVPERLEEMRALVRRVGEVCGPDRPAASLSQPDLLAFKTARMAMPWRLSAEERALSLPRIAARYEGRAVERVSPITVQKDLALLNALFEWALRHKLVEANPVKGLRLPKATLVRGRRAEFSSEQLAQLFASPVYAGCASPARRWEPGSLVLRDALYWLPLLAPYTGARPEELGQLTVGDVVAVEGVACIRIDTVEDDREAEEDAGAGPARRRGRSKADGGKSVKTEGSRRVVPLHPVLVELGFLDHVAQARAAGHRHVFPELEANRHGKRTHAFSKRFARYLGRIGLSDPGLVFHSFRHSFKTAARAAGLPEEVHDALTGHTGGGVGRRYGSVPIPELARAVARLGHPAISTRLLSRREAGTA